MTPEQKLQSLFAADRPAAPDYLFQTAVAQRIAVRRAWLTVAAMVPWAVAAACGLWALQPVLQPMGDQIGDALGPAAGMLGIGLTAALGALWLARQGRRMRA